MKSLSTFKSWNRSVLKYELVLETTNFHEKKCLEYKDHQVSHGGANSVPSYNNPLMSAHTIQRHRLSDSGRNWHWCGKSHELGNCPPKKKPPQNKQKALGVIVKNSVLSEGGVETDTKEHLDMLPELWPSLEP